LITISAYSPQQKDSDRWRFPFSIGYTPYVMEVFFREKLMVTSYPGNGTALLENWSGRNEEMALEIEDWDFDFSSMGTWIWCIAP